MIVHLDDLIANVDISNTARGMRKKKSKERNHEKDYFCPIVNFTHCQQYRSRVFELLAIFGNGHILQWDQMTKINILRSWDKENMFIHTRGSATKRFAKFGRQKRTFCGEKEGKAVSPTKSDRLYLFIYCSGNLVRQRCSIDYTDYWEKIEEEMTQLSFLGVWLLSIHQSQDIGCGSYVRYHSSIAKWGIDFSRCGVKTCCLYGGKV